MKEIELRLKEKYFNAVLEGRKVQEFREIRPNNEKKFIELDGEYAVEDENGNCVPVKYDVIKFVCGERWCRVEVKEAWTELLVNESGDPIWYDYYGERYYAERVVYNLGKILDYGK